LDFSKPGQRVITPAPDPVLDQDGYAALLSALRGNERLSRIVSEKLSDLDRWQAERAEWLQERRLLRAMIDQVPDYLFVKDIQCRFVIANKAVAADLGSDPDDILGKTDLELHPAPLAGQFYEIDLRVITSGEPFLDREEYVVRPNGEKRWLSTSKLPLKNEAGSIIGLVGIARDITARKTAEDEIRYLAYHDQLTGLRNRPSLEAELTKVQSTSALSQSHLLLIDLDRFKQVNDTLGHRAGDALLRQVADALAGAVGDDGTAFRIGGDEFAVVLRDASGLSSLCERILARLDTPFPIEGAQARIGASIGATTLSPGATKPMVALREADIALYESKGRGGGQWRLFEPQMASTLDLRHRLERDLRAALDADDEIYAVFQPVYSVDRQRMVGAEALARWTHPDEGVLSPAVFIPVAETSGLISALGSRMIEAACDLLGHSDLPWIAVNVSPIQLGDPEFEQTLYETVQRHGLDPGRLQIEITEGVLLENRPEITSRLSRLRQAGFCIALDDFGTGYSSLNYLSRFPIDKLKIDRCFVSEIGSKSADAIVRAIVSLAYGLDMKVTAEGVETESQRRFLQQAGCTEIQGYLASHPLSAASLMTPGKG